MKLFSASLSFFSVAIVPASQSRSELRWELASIAIGVVVLSIGLANLSLFFMQQKTDDRSLVFFSLFSLLYAVRLIFRQKLVESVVTAPSSFWKYSDLVIDCVIVIPLTLFLIETVPARWKLILRWLLAFQITFEAARLLSVLLTLGKQPMRIAHSIVIVACCALLVVYSFARGGTACPESSKYPMRGSWSSASLWFTAT